MTQRVSFSQSEDAAFPTHPEGEDGMSVREYFAGQALVGLIRFADSPTKLDSPALAEAAFNIADAMIEESRRQRQ